MSSFPVLRSPQLRNLQTEGWEPAYTRTFRPNDDQYVPTIDGDPIEVKLQKRLPPAEMVLRTAGYSVATVIGVPIGFALSFLSYPLAGGLILLGNIRINAGVNVPPVAANLELVPIPVTQVDDRAHRGQPQQLQQIPVAPLRNPVGEYGERIFNNPPILLATKNFTELCRPGEIRYSNQTIVTSTRVFRSVYPDYRCTSPTNQI